MIRSKPITPATTVIAVPPPQPRRWNTVDVASVASTTSTVSQPTVSNHDSAAGSLLPRTPNAARLSTIVGADPRLPASAISPHSRNDAATPTTPAMAPCQNETPKPSTNEP